MGLGDVLRLLLLGGEGLAVAFASLALVAALSHFKLPQQPLILCLLGLKLPHHVLYGYP